MMYERNNHLRLLILRLSLIVLGTICSLAFMFNNQNLGYFIIVIILSLSFIVVNGFSVQDDSFQISRYYFFGIFKKRWQFHKVDHLKISSFGPGFGEDGNSSYLDDGETGLGCLFSLFTLFVPPKIQRREFKIESFTDTNDRQSTVSIILNKEEYNYLVPFIIPGNQGKL